jgi:hypothetical protein
MKSVKLPQIQEKRYARSMVAAKQQATQMDKMVKTHLYEIKL